MRAAAGRVDPALAKWMLDTGKAAERFKAEIFKLSVQQLAAFSEPTLGPKLLHGALSLAPASPDAKDLRGYFDAEAAALDGVAASGRALVALVARTLACWVDRLRAEGVTGRAALEALLQSRAPCAALVALARNPGGRAVLRACRAAEGEQAPSTVIALQPEEAAEPAGEVDAAPGDAPTARPSKSSSRSRAAKGGVGSSRALAPAADVPALLREVLGRAAPQASAALLEQLLQLLADAAEVLAEDPAAERSPAHEGRPAGDLSLGALLKSQDAQWVIALLSATLSRVGELRTDEHRADVVAQALAEARGEALPLDGEAEEDAGLTPGGVVDEAAQRGAPGDEAWRRRVCAASALGGRLAGLGALLRAPQHEAAESEAALRAAASCLEVLRGASERRVEVLGGVAADCVLAARSCEDRLVDEGRASEERLAESREARAGLLRRSEELQREREELKARLWALEEELATVSDVLAKTEMSEKELRRDTKRAAEELQWEATTGAEAGRRAALQRRFLIEAGAVSRDVEALLAARAEGVARGGAPAEAAGSAPVVADPPPAGGSAAQEACVEVAVLQLRQVEALRRALAAELEAGGARKELASLAALRAAHVEVLDIVGRAQLDLATLAAPGGLAAGATRALAARYAAIEEELEDNLQRIARAEFSTSFSRLEAEAEAGKDESAEASRCASAEAEE